MGGLQRTTTHRDRLRRAGSDAGAATAAPIGRDLRQRRTAQPRAKADRTFRAGITAALADDAPRGETICADGCDMRETSDGTVEDRLGASVRAGSAERAFPCVESQGRPTIGIERDDVLRASRHAGAAARASGCDRCGARPWRADCLGAGKTAASQKATAFEIDAILFHGWPQCGGPGGPRTSWNIQTRKP